MRLRQLPLGFCALLLSASVCLRAQTPQTDQPVQNAVQQQLKASEDEVDQLGKQGKFAEAMPIAQNALRLAEKTFGPEDDNVARELFLLCILSHQLNNYTDAEQFGKRALGIREKVLPADDMRVDAIVRYLALVYSEDGKYSDAESLLVRSLPILEKKVGPDDPRTIAARSNLAEVYNFENKYADAEPLCREVLAYREKTLAANDPNLARALDDLAEAYGGQRKYAEAEPLYRRSLGIYQNALGPDNPKVVDTLVALATLYSKQIRYAEPLSRHAVAIMQKTLAPDDPKLANALSHLGAVCRAQANYGEAESLDKQALAIVQKAYGPDHPDVASALDNRRAVLIGNPAFDLSEPEQRAAVSAFRGTGETQTLVAGLAKPALSVDQPSPAALNGTSTIVARGQRSRDAQSRALDPLPGTQKEIESAGGLFTQQGWQVETYSQQNALEEVMKAVKNPKVLHVATHGFFEPDQVSEPGEHQSDEPSGQEDPMLRSGLYFAGANRTLAGQAPVDLEDGVMTAFEATGLNLQGTELVVLSACETGLGHIRNGEGIFGLQRAMQEAGAGAVLMSMWSVPDEETQELMTMFYAKWLAGKSKHEAFHEAQLELRKAIIARWGADRPYYWAAFVLAGR